MTAVVPALACWCDLTPGEALAFLSLLQRHATAETPKWFESVVERETHADLLAGLSKIAIAQGQYALGRQLDAAAQAARNAPIRDFGDADEVAW